MPVRDACRRMVGVAERVADAFSEAQRSQAVHAKQIRALFKVQKTDPQLFREVFLNLVHHILRCSRKDRCVSRLLKFIVAFSNASLGVSAEGDVAATNASADSEFGAFLLESLVAYSGAKDKTVRGRVCELIALIMQSMDENAEISEELYERIMTAMMCRLRDTVPSIRAQGVRAVARMQDSPDVIREYVRLMTLDPSRDVRRSVIEILGVSRLTLPALLRRTRDVNAEIRAFAYSALGEKGGVAEKLSPQTRAELMEDGLRDRVESVRSAAGALLRESWLSAAAGHDALRLLRLFAEQLPEISVAEEATLELVLPAAFSDPSLRMDFPPHGPECEFPFLARLLASSDDCDGGPVSLLSGSLDEATERRPKEVDGDIALLLRIYCDWLAGPGHGADRLDDLVPNTSEFLQVVQANLGNSFVTRQLLLISRHLDLGDEVGRSRLSVLLRRILADRVHPQKVLEIALEVLRRVHPVEQEYTILVVELISSVRDSLESASEGDAAAVRPIAGSETAALDDMVRRLEELQLQKDRRESQEDFGGAAATHREMSELASTLDRLKLQAASAAEPILEGWLLVTRLCVGLLQNTRKDLTDPLLSGLLGSTIHPAIRQATAEIRASGVRCLGLYCLLGLEEARSHLYLLLQVVRKDEAVVQAAALQTFFDLLVVFGKQLVDGVEISEFGGEGNEGSASDQHLSIDSLLDTLAFFLVHPDVSLRCIATEGFAKLLLNDVVEAPKVLSTLIVMYFNPVTESASLCRQCLAVFFPAYASSYSHQRALLVVAAPTLNVFVRAAKNSSLAQVPVPTVARFFFFLLDRSRLPPRAEQPPEGAAPLIASFAEKLSYEVLVQPKGKEAKMYLRIFALMRFVDHSRQRLVLFELLRMMEDSAPDVASKRHLAKYRAMLEAGCAAPDSEGGEQVDLTEEQKATVRENVEALKAR